MTDTTLQVTEADSFYYVEFRYQNMSAIDSKIAMPNKYFIAQNYPNPFNPQTTITYGLQKQGKVEVAVFNILGEKFATLVDEVQPAGTHSVKWNGSAAASGVYLYRIQTDDFVQTKKMILIK